LHSLESNQVSLGYEPNMVNPCHSSAIINGYFGLSLTPNIEGCHPVVRAN